MVNTPQNDSLEDFQRYHEKQYKLYKQQKMMILGGGVGHGANAGFAGQQGGMMARNLAGVNPTGPYPSPYGAGNLQQMQMRTGSAMGLPNMSQQPTLNRYISN